MLSNLSKFFEYITYHRVQNFRQKSKFVPQNQFGFSKNRNTELAVLSLWDKLLPAIEEEIFVICVFLDYSACFDTLSRSILYNKLEKYGIRGASLDFIEAYFSNRS